MVFELTILDDCVCYAHLMQVAERFGVGAGDYAAGNCAH